MKAYTYIEKGRFELLDKPKPQLQDTKDAYSMFENKEDGVIKIAIDNRY